MRKTVYLLNIDDYAPELTALTYPHIEAYAERIGADVYVMSDRRFPDWAVDYEKFQIHELMLARGDEWAIYIDSDALVHPELPDVTALLPPDTVAHQSADFAPIRWRPDEFFLRDGRNIGSCSWLVVCSRWCRDLWRPLEDLSFEEAVANIRPRVSERRAGITAAHLIADYALSRNIARYGLKFMSLPQLWAQSGLDQSSFFHHGYMVSVEEKIRHMRAAIKEGW